MKILKTTIWTAVGLFGLAALVAMPAAADQVILDDLIVDGSACIGQDCVNGESFGFDTIRIKENNLRIKAQDTSSTASFPTQDWQITFNDSTNGGQNKFSIDAISPSTGTPLTIEAGAPSHSLYVDDGGRLGFGTSTPVADLHVKSGNTPTLRLEQDGSSGFAAQTWDVAGNEAGFFIRDATNGSTLPFRIRPGAPSSSIDIAGDGQVGIGTSNPDLGTSGNFSQLTVAGSSTTAVTNDLINTNSGDVNYVLERTGGTSSRWAMFLPGGSTDLRLFSTGGPGGAPQVVVGAATGDLTVTGELFSAGGTCGSGCDLVFSPDHEVESIEDHAAAMWERRHLPAVGPTEENAASWNISQKTGGMLHELEVAHIYIEQLNDQLKAKASGLEALREQNAELAARLAALEGLVLADRQ